MPSPRDLDLDLDLDAPVVIPDGPPGPEDVLARVKSEGVRRRTRRHRRNGILAVLGLACLAVPAAALVPGDDGPEEVQVAGEGEGQSEGDGGTGSDVGPATTEASSPSTTVPSPSSTTPPTQPGGADAEATDETGDTEDPSPATTATTLPDPVPTTVPPPVDDTACRNSHDEACGAFRWDPAPAPNQPLTAGFVDVPSEVVAGEPVTFVVAWSDPDADIAYESFSADGTALGQACTQEARFGTWTPPPAVPGSGELVYTHTFVAPGEHLVTVALGTGDCMSPYGDGTSVDTVVTVVAP